MEIKGASLFSGVDLNDNAAVMARIRILSAKPQMLILSGLPASGKTTIAKAWVTEDPDSRIRVNWDDMRLARYGEYWKFNRKEENDMKAASYEVARKALQAGLSVVIDNTNLTPKVRAMWAQIGANAGAEVIYEEVDTSVLECVRRDRARSGHARVGRAVIERMALDHGFIDWQDYPNRFVICDIDGTLSDPTHRLHLVKGGTFKHKMDCTAKCSCGNEDDGAGCPRGCPARIMREFGRCPQCGAREFKDWDKFHELVSEDPVKAPISKLLGHFRSLGYHIIICSGRWLDKGCGKATEDWLELYNIQYDHLFMRAGSDSREDSIVKQEILDLLPKDKIDYVLDDRDRVVTMWRKNGLTCLQVSPGGF